MRARIAAIAVLAAGLALGTTGCTFLTPVATLNHYDPSDGIGVTVGDLQLRNLFAVSPTGKDAALVGAFINSGDTDETVRVQYTSHPTGDATTVTKLIRVKAGASVILGDPGVKQFVLSTADAKPGALLTVFVQYGDVSGKKIRIPVLDGSQPAYEKLAPSPTPTATATPTPTATATPAVR